jgi:N-acetylmuramoyl-L-alanine amidase
VNTKLDRKLAGKSFEVNDSLLKSVRVAQFKAGQSRIVLDLEGNSAFTASLLANPPRLMIEIRGGEVDSDRSHAQPGKPPTTATDVTSATEAADDGESESSATPAPVSETDILPTSARNSRRTTVGANGVKKTIVDADDDDVTTKTPVANLDPPPDVKPVNKIAATSGPSLRATSNGKNKRKAPTTSFDMREAQPTASGDRSLIRALGLKIGKIVIDPGHGGHDTGTIGPNGLEEKDLVLDVSRRLGKLLQARLGAEVIYTRKDDTFIPLETRTALANQESADLFVSVHANSSHDPDARGVETYYLNFTSSPEALEVAARENAVSEKSIHELQDLVKKIALREKIEESHEFASDVQNSLHTGLAAKNPGVRDRGVKKAPFIVLIGANMPSILAEISFVSNPGDEHRLQNADYRQRIAESLYRGIAKYVSGLSGVKVASKIDKDEGQ